MNPCSVKNAFQLKFLTTPFTSFYVCFTKPTHGNNPLKGYTLSRVSTPTMDKSKNITTLLFRCRGGKKIFLRIGTPTEFKTPPLPSCKLNN